MTERDTNQKGSLRLWVEITSEIIGRPTEKLTLLDLFCNETTSTKQFKWKCHVGVDVEHSSGMRCDLFYQRDALTFLKEQKHHYDVCICCDGIEHPVKSESLMILDEMERAADLCIVFTPIGPAFGLEPESTNPHVHKSSWMPDDFKFMGWSTMAFPNWHGDAGAFFAWKGSV